MDSSVLVLVIALLFLFSVKSQQIADPQLPGSSSPPLSPPPPPPPPPQPPSLVSPPPRKPLSPGVEGNHKSNKHLKPPPVKEKTNLGRRIGLVFVGVASILQICIVAFLLISRIYLLRTRNGYQRN